MNRKNPEMREDKEKYTPHPVVFAWQIALTFAEREEWWCFQKPGR